MMKAVVLDKESVGPDALQKLRVAEVAKPQPGPTQVLVKVDCAAINPVDWKMAEYGFLIKSFPTVLGCDVAGVVESVGAEVKSVKVGDRVYGYPDLGTTYGSFGEYTMVDQEFVSAVPEGISAASASTLPVGALTASLGLYRDGGVLLPSEAAASGEAKRNILIWGAAGSVGSYAVQLAHASGLRVIAVCSARSSERVKALGAAATVDYNSPSVAADIQAALGGEPLTLAFDTVSTASATQIAKLLASDSPATLLCIAGNPDASAVPENVTVKSVGLGDAYHVPDKRAAIPAYLREINVLVEAGKLEPNEVQDAGHGLDAIIGALKTQKSGSSGSRKVVVRLA